MITWEVLDIVGSNVILVSQLFSCGCCLGFGQEIEICIFIILIVDYLLFAPWFLPFTLEGFSTYILVFCLIVFPFYSAAYFGLLVFVPIQRLFLFISPSTGIRAGFW